MRLTGVQVRGEQGKQNNAKCLSLDCRPPLSDAIQRCCCWPRLAQQIKNQTAHTRSAVLRTERTNGSGGLTAAAGQASQCLAALAKQFTQSSGGSVQVNLIECTPTRSLRERKKQPETTTDCL